MAFTVDYGTAFQTYATAFLASEFQRVGASNSVQSALGPYGENTLRFTSMDNGELRHALKAASAKLIIQGHFRIASLADTGHNTNTKLFGFMDGTTRQVDVVVTSGGSGQPGTLSTTRNGTVIQTSTFLPVVGTWYPFEWFVEINNTTGSSVMRIGGVGGTLIFNDVGTLNTRASANNQATQFWLGSVTNNSLSGLNCELTNVIVLRDVGGTADFLGEKRVFELLPTGAGNYSGSTIGGSAPAATRWQSVADTAPDADVTNVQAAAAGVIDTYTKQALPTGTSGIVAVGKKMVALKTDVGTVTARTKERQGSVDRSGATAALTNAYASYYDWDQAKIGGGAYSKADVDACEIGWERVA